MWFLGRGSISQLSTWFLVQTNYDHWNKPPFFDDRRDPAIHCLDKMGRNNASRAGLYDVFSTIPVLNQVYPAIDTETAVVIRSNFVLLFVADSLHDSNGCQGWCF